MSDGTERGISSSAQPASWRDGRRASSPGAGSEHPRLLTSRLARPPSARRAGRSASLRARPPLNAIGRSLRFWERLRVLGRARSGDRGEQERDAGDLRHARRRERRPGRRLRRAAPGSAGAMTLAAFRPTDADAANVCAVIQWLRDIQIAQVVTSTGSPVRRPHSISTARAAGARRTWRSRWRSTSTAALRRRVAILNERAPTGNKLRGRAFGPEYEQRTPSPRAGYGSRSLTISARSSRAPESDLAHLQNAWGAVPDRRYNCRRW